MRASLLVGVALAIVAIAGRADAQPSLTQRDGQGPVTVIVTLAVPPQVGVPIRANIILDTHSIALDGIAFERAVVLRPPGEVDVAPTGVEGATDGGHHREAVVMFPPVMQPGTVRIVVKNVGGIAERSFTWELSPKP
jgi:hypothetical protein